MHKFHIIFITDSFRSYYQFLLLSWTSPYGFTIFLLFDNVRKSFRLEKLFLLSYRFNFLQIIFKVLFIHLKLGLPIIGVQKVGKDSIFYTFFEGILQHQHSIETQMTDTSSKQSTISADSCLPKSQVSLSDRLRSHKKCNIMICKNAFSGDIET